MVDFVKIPDMMPRPLLRAANLIGAITLTALFGCATTPPATPDGPRKIVLNGTSYSESDMGKIISWRCNDYVNGGRTLLEVGTFENARLGAFGFVLYDGGNAGEPTHYRRSGINHRWDWGPHTTEYAFIIKPDGTGLYYDFSSVQAGKSATASEVYRCYRNPPDQGHAQSSATGAMSLSGR
jgi:hypothetical protein